MDYSVLDKFELVSFFDFLDIIDFPFSLHC